MKVKNYANWLENGENDDLLLQQLMFRLPKDNAMAFAYLVAFFRDLLEHRDKNGLSALKVAEIMADCLIGRNNLKVGHRNQSLVRAMPTKRKMSEDGYLSEIEEEPVNPMMRLRQQGLLLHFLT